MKNKYMILALLPILFQSALYGADLNKMIETELKSAHELVKHKHVALELDPILSALVQHGKKSDRNSVDAINKIKDIKNALLQYRSEQYTSNWYNICSYFKSNPEIVTNEIDPAIKKVNTTLKALQSNASIYGYVKATALVAVIALIGAAAYVNRKEIADTGNKLHENYNSGEFGKQLGEAANTAESYVKGYYRDATGQGSFAGDAERFVKGDSYTVNKAAQAVGSALDW